MDDRFNNSGKESDDMKNTAKSASDETCEREDGDEAARRILGAGAFLHRHVPASPDEVVLASAAIAITLCRHKSVDEIQTLLNLFSTTSDLIDSILKQRLINKPFEEPVLSVDLD